MYKFTDVKSEPKWDESQYGGSEDTTPTKVKEHTPATYELKDSMSLKNVPPEEIPSLMTQVYPNTFIVENFFCHDEKIAITNGHH